MAQVFGNRILGGIGAPGGGMAESFGAGVNTTLGQRTARQAMDVNAQNMAIQQQEMAWKGEDRKIAAQQRAAAAAASAAAKAKAAALNDAWMRIYGGNGATKSGMLGLAGSTLPSTAPAAPSVARDRQGPAAPATPAAPARPAGVRVPTPEVPLSFGKGAVAGGAGTTTLPGGPGGDRLVTPPPTVATVPAAPRVATPAAPGVAAPPAYTADAVFDPITGVLISGGVVNEVIDPYATGDTMTDFTLSPVQRKQLLEQRALIEANAKRAAGVAAPATAGAPAGTVTVTMPDGSKLPLEMGSTNGSAVTPAQLSFGPKLGAVPETREDIAIDSFVAATGVDLNAPAPPRMGQPGQPNRAITRLMEQRDQQAQWTQALISAGRYDEARAAQAEIMGIDTKLEAAVARLALNEATMFNAPQRLSAVWSDFTGQQYEFQPSTNGGLDVYVNGELMDQGLPMNTIEQNTLMMTDQAYAAQQTELATLTATERAKGMGQAEANIYEYQQKAAIDIQKASQVGMDSIQLDLIKQELGIGEQDKIDFQKDDQSGIVLVFKNDKLAAQYAPTEITPEGGTPYVSFQQIQ